MTSWRYRLARHALDAAEAEEDELLLAPIFRGHLVQPARLPSEVSKSLPLRIYNGKHMENQLNFN